MTVLSGIDAALAAAIAAAATPTYQYNYGAVNTQDPSAWDASKAIPFTRWLASSGAPDQSVGKTTEITPIEIRVLLPVGSGLTDLQTASQGEEDIRRLMGASVEALRGAGVLGIPVFKSSSWMNRGVAARPVEVIVVYHITWRTDFLNPSST